MRSGVCYSFRRNSVLLCEVLAPVRHRLEVFRLPALALSRTPGAEIPCHMGVSGGGRESNPPGGLVTPSTVLKTSW